MGDAQEPIWFISGFCDDAKVPERFGGLPNLLKRFTPCFIDTVILGVSFVVSIILILVRWRIVNRAKSPVYNQKGGARAYQWSANIACLVCTFIPIMQLGARLNWTTDPVGVVPMSPIGPPAPYEWIGYLLPVIMWLLMTVVQFRELKRFTWVGLWTIRFPLVLVAASHLAKFAFMYEMEQTLYYWVFVSYICVQCFLAIFAVSHIPRASSLEPVVLVGSFYQALPDRDGVEDAPSSLLTERIFPEASAGFFSRLTFSWIGSLIRKGFKCALQEDDIWKLPEGDRAESINGTYTTKWKKEVDRTKSSKNGPGSPSLLRTMANTVGHLFLLAIPVKLISDASQFVGPVFLDLLLGSVDADDPKWVGFAYAGSLFVGLMIGTIADNQHFQLVMRAGFRLRSVITAEVHRKSLFLTPTARAKYSSGRVFNLVASDAESIQTVSQNLLGVISSPIRIIGAMYLLYLQLGLSSLVALASIILVIPIQGFVANWGGKLMKKALHSTDERAKFEGELVSGIEVVKCNAWEQPLLNRIMYVRTAELKVLWKSFVLGAFNVFMMSSIPVIVSVLTFAVYIQVSGNVLTAQKAFTSITLFSVLRFPLFQLPQLVTQLTQASVSMRRLEEFFREEEQTVRHKLDAPASGGIAVSIHGDFTWDTNIPPYLHKIDLDIPAGSLVMIVGSSGCGKTSLTSAMLGLMQQVLNEKPPKICGTVALVPQSPFIFNATIQDNILFGEPFDERKYARAIEAASLAQDFASLPAGDQTELGERGINISGGQKQRVAIARAVYSSADVFILDDPLSALDSKVARRVFNQCLLKEIADKTRIFVTNQLQFVSSADWVVYMHHGEIAEMGTFQDLMKKSGGFAHMMSEAQVEQDESHADGKNSQGKKEEPIVAAEETRSRPLKDGLGPDRQVSAKKEGGLVRTEGRSTGSVSRDVIWSYCVAMGGLFPGAFLMLQFVIVEVFRVGASLWLTDWTKGSEEGASHSQTWYMNIYAAISLAQIVFALLNSLYLKWVGRTAADSLHKEMILSIIRAPMAFFHTTPVGRIINRCTKDTSDIDRNLVDMFGFFMRSLLQLLTTIALIGVFTPFTLPCMVPILMVFYFLYIYFQASVREIKRLDAVSRSPLYSSMNEAIQGLPTIKAFSAEERLINRHWGLIDSNVRMNLANQSLNRWLSIRLETLGALTALFAAILAVEQGNTSSVMGLTLSFALQITSLTSITVRLGSLTENMFNAVERVVEYGGLDSEAATDIDGSVEPRWPDKGSINFSNVKMRYRPGLPLVLQGFDATIEGGQKIGVVGRTGAGKSSLINALFRLAELDEGSIHVDGVDISAIGLSQLRSRMAIIPQVPVLFTGTIRSNLDPLSQHTDTELWTVVRRSHLDHAIESSSMGLDMPLQEGGAPLSAGQRQLLTLARALLKKSKILVLDEATASIDVETDALIQTTIREEFAECTVLAVAHRLHTIIDGDKVMVLDKGQLAEFDSPANLLANRDGIFTSMVHETGEATEKFLRGVALGNVDIDAVWAQDATRGLERVASPLKLCETSVSCELLERVKATLVTLETVKGNLHAEQESYRRQMGTSKGFLASAGSELLDALKLALKLVAEVQDLAQDTDNLINDTKNQTAECLLAEIQEKGQDTYEDLEGSSVGFTGEKKGWQNVRALTKVIGLHRRAQALANDRQNGN